MRRRLCRPPRTIAHRSCPNQLDSVGNEIGVDPAVILQTSHGRRSIDMLKVLAPEKANWECECACSPGLSCSPGGFPFGHDLVIGR